MADRGVPVSLPRDFEAPDVPQQVIRLADTVHTVERRLLQLVEEASEGAVPLDDLDGELSLLGKEIARCYRQIGDIKDRRDLGFQASTKLEELDHHCIWLYRKTHLEQYFFRKWHLETRLRGLVSADALTVYQEILSAEVSEKEFLVRGDVEIRRLLLEEGRGCGRKSDLLTGDE